MVSSTYAPRSELHMHDIFLIIGVNGVGKSTLVSHLSGVLDSGLYSTYDFDERGVPDNADRTWRQAETLHWLTVGKENAARGMGTVICGFMKPSEIEDIQTKLEMNVHVCLLDADEATISRRILGRYINAERVAELDRTTGKTPERLVTDNVWVASQFRQAANEKGYCIVETSRLTSEDVCRQVVAWIRSKHTRV